MKVNKPFRHIDYDDAGRLVDRVYQQGDDYDPKKCGLLDKTCAKFILNGTLDAEGAPEGAAAIVAEVVAMREAAAKAKAEAQA